MAKSINTWQKSYIEEESTFATHSGDFGSGVQLKPKEVIKLDGIGKNLLSGNVAKTSRTDEEIIVVGKKEAKISFSHILSGATRDSGDVDPDGLSEALELLVGYRDESVSDSCDTSSTATNLILVGGGSYSAGDIVVVNGEARLVGSVNGTADITLSSALSSAPSVSDLISNTEWYNSLSDTDSLASFSMALEGDDSEMTYVLKGGTAETLSISAFKGASEAMSFDVSAVFADWSRGDSITPASTVCPNSGVVGGSSDGLSLNDNSGTLWQPCTGEASSGSVIKNALLANIGGTNGYCGVVSLMPDDKKITVTMYQDGSLSKLESLADNQTSTPIILQAGNSLGSIVGIAVPNAKVLTYPKGADLNGMNAVTVEFSCDEIKLFRA